MCVPSLGQSQFQNLSRKYGKATADGVHSLLDGSESPKGRTTKVALRRLVKAVLQCGLVAAGDTSEDTSEVA